MIGRVVAGLIFGSFIVMLAVAAGMSVKPSCGWVEARGFNGDIIKLDLSKATAMYEAVHKSGDTSTAITKVWHGNTWTGVAVRMAELTKDCWL